MATAQRVLPHLTVADQHLLEEEIIRLKQFVNTNTPLPQAIIHGDLFRDNVLAQGKEIKALIDFFSAGTGFLLLDLAIVVNDWCFDPQATLNSFNYNALITCYSDVRTPQTMEIEQWSRFLRIAALRFWVSRLNEQLIAGPNAPLGRGKDPAVYRRLLLLHRDAPLSWPSHR